MNLINHNENKKRGTIVLWREDFMCDNRLSAGVRNSLFALSTFMNKSGDCFPSQKTIANRAGLTERTIRKHLKTAVDLGWVERYLNKGKLYHYKLSYPTNWCQNTLKPDSDIRNILPVHTEVLSAPCGNNRHSMRNFVPIKENNKLEHKIDKEVVIHETMRNEIFPPSLNEMAWYEYREYRKTSKLKKLNPDSEKKLVIWLVRQGDDDKQQKIIDQTIRNGWQGLFELKEDKSEKSKLYNQKSRAECFSNKLDEIAKEDFKENGFISELG